MKNIVFLCLFLFSIRNFSQHQDSITNNRAYHFILYDQPTLHSMGAFNSNYLNGLRLVNRQLNTLTYEKKLHHRLNKVIQFGFIVFVGMPLTHEEGHRSVLTNKGIGSISQPFFNSKGAAYVKGVTDETLVQLRHNDFTSYIRLHTAGLESDYSLQQHEADLLVFEEENYSTLASEYFLRKLSPIQYHLTSFIPKMMPDIVEEDNELDRDIVGHDIWGMVRHLHRPDMTFYRYTQFDDLTSEEKSYAKKIAWRSMSNLLDPLIIGKKNFRWNENLKFNIAIAHSLSPFGDYLDQNYWFLYQNKYKIKAYTREYFNKNHTFFATGIGLYHYDVIDKFQISITTHFWKQPKNVSFITSVAKTGFGTDARVQYKFFNNNESKIKSLGIFADIFYKTNGFLPEYASLDKDFGIRVGLGFRY